LDTTFLSGSGFDAPVRDAAIQPDWKFFLGGQFSTYQGLTVKSVVRLLPTEEIDPTFSFGKGAYGWTNPATIEVWELEIDNPGRILAGEYSGFLDCRF